MNYKYSACKSSCICAMNMNDISNRAHYFSVITLKLLSWQVMKLTKNKQTNKKHNKCEHELTVFSH